MSRPLLHPNEAKSDQEKNLGQHAENAFWKDAKERNAKIETHEEVQVFHLTPEEAQKCVFSKPDNNFRMAECITHKGNFSHGVRMFPPHLWDWKEGYIYQKVNGEWVRWTADVKQNIQRLEKEEIDN